MERIVWNTDLSSGTLHVFPGLISCGGVWRGHVHAGISVLLSLNFWSCKDTNSNTEDDKGCDTASHNSGKIRVVAKSHHTIPCHAICPGMGQILCPWLLSVICRQRFTLWELFARVLGRLQERSPCLGMRGCTATLESSVRSRGAPAGHLLHPSVGSTESAPPPDQVILCPNSVLRSFLKYSSSLNAVFNL